MKAVDDGAARALVRRDLGLFSGALVLGLAGSCAAVMAGQALRVAPVWDFGAMAGVVGFLLLVCVLVVGARPDPWPRCGGKFSLVLHRWLGTGVLVAVAVHVAAMFCATPAMLRYVEPGAPWYMLAGVLAALLVAVVGGGAYGVPRRRLFRTAAMFRRWHGCGALAVIGFSAWHVLGTGFHVGGVVRVAVCGLVCAGAAVRSAVTMVRLGHPVAAGPGRRIHAIGAARGLAAAVFVLSGAVALVFALLPHQGAG